MISTVPVTRHCDSDRTHRATRVAAPVTELPARLRRRGDVNDRPGGVRITPQCQRRRPVADDGYRDAIHYPAEVGRDSLIRIYDNGRISRVRVGDVPRPVYKLPACGWGGGDTDHADG